MFIYLLQAENWQCIELSLKCSNVLCFISFFLLYKLEQHLIFSHFIPAAFALPDHRRIINICMKLYLTKDLQKSC